VLTAVVSAAAHIGPRKPQPAQGRTLVHLPPSGRRDSIAVTVREADPHRQARECDAAVARWFSAG